MKNLISGFTKQLKQALEISENVSLSTAPYQFANVVISGMGGSGTVGNITAEASLESSIPIIINKDYFLPHFVSHNTLVIISSYSGDTEETNKAMEDALNKGAHIICVTSGGRIKQLALKKGIDVIEVPPGIPPQLSLAFSLVQLLHIFSFHGIISKVYKKDITRSIELLNAEEENIIIDAQKSAIEFLGKNIIVYSSAGMESVALRFRQQINENSKGLCWHHTFPELNHNELQGWREGNENHMIVLFRNDTDYMRTSKRMDIFKDLVNHNEINVKEVFSKGDSILERMLYFIHWADWVTYFMAELKGIDPMDMRPMEYLKSEMAKIEEY